MATSVTLMRYVRILYVTVKFCYYLEFFVMKIHKFWGDFGLSLSVALVWTLAFESPVLVLEKLLLKRERNTSKPIKNGEAIVNGTDSQQKV